MKCKTCQLLLLLLFFDCMYGQDCNAFITSEFSSWRNSNERGTIKYQVEREQNNENDFSIIGANGQLFYSTEVKNISSSTFTCPRDNKMKPGIYLLRITDKITSRTETRKLVFE